MVIRRRTRSFLTIAIVFVASFALCTANPKAGKSFTDDGNETSEADEKPSESKPAREDKLAGQDVTTIDEGIENGIEITQEESTENNENSAQESSSTTQPNETLSTVSETDGSEISIAEPADEDANFTEGSPPSNANNKNAQVLDSLNTDKTGDINQQPVGTQRDEADRSNTRPRSSSADVSETSTPDIDSNGDAAAAAAPSSESDADKDHSQSIPNEEQDQANQEADITADTDTHSDTPDKPLDPDYLDLDDPPAGTLRKQEDDKEQPLPEIGKEELSITSADRDENPSSEEDGSDKILPNIQQEGKNVDIAQEINATVNEEEQASSGQVSEDGSTTNETTNPNDDEVALDKSYSGTWGLHLGKKRYADLQILGLLFDKNLVGDASQRYGKVFEAIDDLVIPTLYSKIMKGEGSSSDDKTEPNVSIPPPQGLESLTDRRSVNTEFVEGLDDLNKFFEDVDPPDELDVGAAGTSMQDVIMGQTSKIIMKRVSKAARYVSKMLKAAKKRLAGDATEGEDRKLPQLKLKLEHLEQARDWVVDRGKGLYQVGKDLFQSIFSDEDELDSDEYIDFADLKKKLESVTGP